MQIINVFIFTIILNVICLMTFGNSTHTPPNSPRRSGSLVRQHSFENPMASPTGSPRHHHHQAMATEATSGFLGTSDEAKHFVSKEGGKRLREGGSMAKSGAKDLYHGVAGGLMKMVKNQSENLGQSNLQIAKQSGMRALKGCGTLATGACKAIYGTKLKVDSFDAGKSHKQATDLVSRTSSKHE